MSNLRLAPTSNLLLASLPPEQYRRLLPDLELVELQVGDAIQKPGLPISHVVFPASGIVSMHYQLRDGAALAIALIGREGLVGISRFMVEAPPSSRSVVQSPGDGYRLGAAVIQREIRNGGHLQVLALRYIQALITQMAQTAVCTRYHNLDQQICRWLLLSLDRLPGSELNMSHELVAQLLGVRRERVSVAASHLQDANVLDYSRGHIWILDRAALEERVCECYAVVRNEYERLLPLGAGTRRHLAHHAP